MVLKKLAWIACIVFLVAACSRDHKYPNLPIKSNVVILGDSLTYGTGANKGEDYATILASNTGWNILNEGVPGNTSSDGLARIEGILYAHEAGEPKIDFLIIELGGNDFLRRIPEVETVNNLRAILLAAKASRIPTVLLAIPQFSPIGAAFGNLSDHPLYEKLAKETNTPLVKNVFSKVLGKNNLKSDHIHPNAEGYRVVASSLRDAFIKLGFVREN